MCILGLYWDHGKQNGNYNLGLWLGLYCGYMIVYSGLIVVIVLL